MLIYLIGAIGLLLLALALMAIAAALAFGPDPDFLDQRRMARPEAVPGCWPCTLAAAASDDHLARHLLREHAA